MTPTSSDTDAACHVQHEVRADDTSPQAAVPIVQCDKICDVLGGDNLDNVLRKLADAPVLGRSHDEELRQVISGLDAAALESRTDDLRALIARFQHKRQRDLTVYLEQRLVAVGSTPSASSAPLVEKVRPWAGGSDLLDPEAWEGALHSLSAYHIFQWATHYRATISDIFNTALSRLARGNVAVIGHLRSTIAAHAKEIFRKGYNYTESRFGHEDAISKSLSGLQRFLAIPIELYSEQAYNVATVADAVHLRTVTSTVLGAIIRGYGEVSFGSRSGWRLLPAFPRSWASYVAFIEHNELAALIELLEPGDFRNGLHSSVAPVLHAVDTLIRTAPADSIYLPRIGQFIWEKRRIELALSFPRNVEKRYLDIHCYLDPGYVGRASLEESIARASNLIVSPVRPDLRSWSEPHDVLRTILLDPTDKDTASIAAQALDILRHEIRKHVGRVGRGEAIVTNLAKGFPLDSPTIRQYFHVSRTSIRALVKSFETETGVRLWCSVRRSGKTTACLDMGTNAVNSYLISQTMDNTDSDPRAGRFYQAFTRAIEAEKQLPRTFFADAVLSCADEPDVEDAGRLIFVLDEYETLFDHLNIIASETPRLRYAIVQPLLNQMVAFSRQNLLIFMGQRPDSHYIIMDQNQLSPYVKQDAFPLFSREMHSGTSEFDELLRKVMTERCTVDEGFAAAVFEETSGHPYLTVNLLVDFFDWMIEERRSHLNLDLKREDFENFSRAWLRPDRLRKSGNYVLFKKYLEHALSNAARKQQPWLYVVMTLMRRIASEHHDLGCSERDFAAHGQDLLAEVEWDPEYLIDSASRANFLTVRNGRVRPTIPLLARLAAVTRPRTV